MMRLPAVLGERLITFGHAQNGLGLVRIVWPNVHFCHRYTRDLLIQMQRIALGSSMFGNFLGQYWQ